MQIAETQHQTPPRRTSYAFDSLAYAKRMESVGFTRQQAETMAEEQGKLIDERLATKDDIDLINANLERQPINNSATVRYTKHGKRLYLIADGEAANFLHCGSVGPYIHLVQGEIFGAALSLLSFKKDRRPYFKAGFYEVQAAQRQLIAEQWKKGFNERPLFPGFLRDGPYFAG